MDCEYLTQRGLYWHYVRRVPACFARLDPRKFIRVSTRKKSQSEALIIADRINKETEAFWQSLLTQHDQAPQSLETYSQAIECARALGVSYKPVMDLAREETKDTVNRTAILEQTKLVNNDTAVRAVLGGAEKPKILISTLFDCYFKYAKDNLRGKSELQIRKWKNPRKKAIVNLMHVIGDKQLTDITRQDALEFRAWWIDRVDNENMDPGTANKDIGHINQMINELNDKLRLGLDCPFSSMRLKGEKHNPRIAYDVDFVQNRLLAENASESDSKVYV